VEKKYKEQEKLVTRIIRNAKRRMERGQANDREDKNGRKFTRYVKTKMKSKTDIGPLRNSQGELVTENRAMADKFNKFFTSVFSRDSSKDIPPLPKECAQTDARLILTERTIKQKIAELRKDAAAGPDGITPKLLKALGDSILKPLVLIFERSLNEGKIPKE
jgi:hypothetical protein